MSKTAAQAKLRVAAGLALIFDLDGVIVDSMPVHELAWRRYLETLGFDGGDIPERMQGRRNDDIVRDFLGASMDHDAVLAHGAAKERVFREMLHGRLRENLVAGIAEWLDRVEGAPIGLATNGERANIDFTLDGAGLRRYFDVIVDGSEVARPKPAADVYLRAAELLKIAPEDCIVFEDSPVGVAAALAAGMRVVGVRTHSWTLDGVVFSVANFLDPQLDGWLAAQRAV
ncbi:MAG: HAD-IA family hydrolase [Acidobacteriota bacterium]|nr:HAD-IA family hydrolase [Acidobacteriota bacterium]